MRHAHTLEYVALAALLVTAGTGLSAQLPERSVPQAPKTSIRSAPTEAETPTRRTKMPGMDSGEKSTTPLLRGLLYHHEYLTRVTPEGFRRSATGAAPGMSGDPADWFSFLSRSWRKQQEARLHEVVEKELAALRANGR